MLKKQQANLSTQITLQTKKIIAVYIAFNIFLITFFDYLLPPLLRDKVMLNNISNIKSWIYLVLTVSLLSLLLKHYTIPSSETELEKNKYLSVLLAAMPDLIFHFDHNGLLIDYKGTNTITLLPNSINPLIGASVYDLLPPLLAEETMVSITKVLTTNEPQVMEYYLPIDHQDHYWEARLIKLNDTQVISILRDTTQHSQLLKELYYVSLHDHLTGLYNRAYFEQQMQQLHSVQHLPITVFICDLDGLKVINDTLGHQFGDQLLKIAATTLSGVFNNNNIIARIGGDEFAILLPNTPPLAAQAAYQRIRAAEAEYNAQTNPIVLNISIGFAVSSEHSANMDELFLEADNKMYKEKNNRKSQQ